MSAARAKVLVVEDHDDARALYVDWLAEAGFDVVETGDGCQAVDLAKQTKPAAVLMDLNLPCLDGWEVTRRIRSLLGADPYIVAVSAFTSDGSRSDAYDAGCDGFVEKPILPETIVKIISAALMARAVI